MNPQYELRQDTNTVVFILKVDSSLKLLIEFMIFDDDY